MAQFGERYRAYKRRMPGVLPFLKGLTVAAIFYLATVSLYATAQSFEATRLLDGEPIISAASFTAVGASTLESASINGPSVIRIPDWVPVHERAAPDALYYLYFAHHKGRYIRMAWAQNPRGPWHLYNTGGTAPDGRRGVLDIGDDRQLDLGDGMVIQRHVASPDVQIDNENRRLLMYFHGPVKPGHGLRAVQRTLVATSRWGLDFSQDIKAAILGPSYFHVFQHDNETYALSRHSLFTPRNSEAPFVVPPQVEASANLWIQKETRIFVTTPGVAPHSSESQQNGRRDKPALQVRHLGLYPLPGRLHVFFTVRGHAPERILMTTVNTDAEGWQDLTSTQPPTEILRPELAWEGGEAPLTPSLKGMADGLQNQLRDPYIFEDGGDIYLFYAGGGEQAIGLAQLTEVTP